MLRTYVVGSVALALVLSACGGTSRGGPAPAPDAGAGDGASGPSMCSLGGPSVVCVGVVEHTCNPDGTTEGTRNCADLRQTCASGIGCSVCQPGRTQCEGNSVMVCRADGSGYDLQEECSPTEGLACSAESGTCRNLCEEAVELNSYIGCEYWPTVTVNSSLSDEFEFAVVVTNPQSVEAEVFVTRGGTMIESVVVQPGDVATIKLPWVSELKQGEDNSVIARGGAYRLNSNVPVTVHQFNPLDFRIPRDCADEAATGGIPDGQCFAYTNDASMLLPSHVFTGNYMVLSRPSQLMRIEQFDTFTGEPVIDPETGLPVDQRIASPGFASIVGVENSPVQVEVHFKAYTKASQNGEIQAQAPGDVVTYTLNQGDVLQLLSQDAPIELCTASSPSDEMPGGLFGEFTTRITYCEVGANYDLTGTEVRATGKVAVVSGHNCTFVPYNRWACDHLEEAMFPLETWGKNFTVSASESLRGEPNVVRIVSGKDGNQVTFSPNVASGTTLSRGEMIEFETNQDFQVTGSEALMAVQFLVGQDYNGPQSSGAMGEGDPSMSLAIPTEQFRSQYTFLAPDSFTTSYVNVTASVGQDVMLGMRPVEGWRELSGTGLQTARVPVQGGSHTITSDRPFGIVVYGFGSFTSYMYPGGLDFNEINVPY